MEPIEVVALFLVILLVLSVNIGLIRAARGKVAFPEFELFRRVAHRARDPWKMQNEDLQELSRLVTELKKNREQPSPKFEETGPGDQETNSSQ